MLRKLCAGAYVAATAVALRLDEEPGDLSQEPGESADGSSGKFAAAGPSLNDVQDDGAASDRQLGDASLSQSVASADDDAAPSADKRWATASADMGKRAKPQDVKDAMVRDLKNEMDAPLAEFASRAQPAASLLEEAADPLPLTLKDGMGAGGSKPDASLSEGSLGGKADSPDLGGPPLPESSALSDGLALDDSSAPVAGMQSQPEDDMYSQLSAGADDTKWASASSAELRSAAAKPEELKNAALQDMRRELAAPLADFAANRGVSLLQQDPAVVAPEDSSQGMSGGEDSLSTAPSLTQSSPSPPAAGAGGMEGSQESGAAVDGSMADMVEAGSSASGSANARDERWAAPAMPHMQPDAMRKQAVSDMQKEMDAPLSEFAPQALDAAQPGGSASLLELAAASYLDQAGLGASQDPVDTNADLGALPPMAGDSFHLDAGASPALPPVADGSSVSENPLSAAMANLKQAARSGGLSQAGGEDGSSDGSESADGGIPSVPAFDDVAKSLAVAAGEEVASASSRPQAGDLSGSFDAAALGGQSSLLQEEASPKALGSETTTTGKAPCPSVTGEDVDSLQKRLADIPCETTPPPPCRWNEPCTYK
eukprot:TRINITY_DN37149_c0_g1_i1.p1 TRINITY_DN37149_c0_g1~~TRINITY_DN37149_c0_g1_i1.p1  ORF type:complete len:600 (+),score=204.46 TRINITY_DN37149_c0_g1_i1:125-1924(+)